MIHTQITKELSNSLNCFFLFLILIKEFAAKEKLEIVKERGEPACGGRVANHEGFSSPPQAAKNVRTNLSIRSQRVIGSGDREAYCYFACKKFPESMAYLIQKI